ncbi:T-cell surface glycoprotein CD3 zeta chain [Carlito syrichta]|uniref:T-cell surface glycoprotein CD3 zeta chain n=1 Tax=Carlito syrichta TaxID=1868482 RepID=A0A3Q0DT88_CARSF|nr:T-cell surface glycoprotein CD3 zeta chain [Carlito syrichta]
MKWKALVIAAILQAQFPVTEAQSFGLLDPKLCYLLDGILFIYGVVITALFLRAKVDQHMVSRALGDLWGSSPPSWSYGFSVMSSEMMVSRWTSYHPSPGPAPFVLRATAQRETKLPSPAGPVLLRFLCPVADTFPVFQELNLGRREEYDVLDKRRGRDPEMGGKQRRKNPQEGLYNALQKEKMAEAYSEIGMKGERRRGKGHDGLYQGLSTATKDTYDALHMQTLPPR